MDARVQRILLAMALAISPIALAAPAQPADPDSQCLACHGQAGLEKTFDRGPPLPLHVDPSAFSQSVHAPLGCATCHADVDLKKHPATPRKFESARALSVAGVETCRGCHGSIFDAFTSSVHGRNAKVDAPICADCHSAHAVTRASVGRHLRDTCVRCHPDTLARHKTWLPNTQRHLESVACAACHSPGADRRIDLRLYDAATKGEPAGRDANLAEGRPVDDKALDALLRSASGKVSLVGRLEASTPEQSHGLARKSEALRDCAACHRKGAAPFRNVTLSVIGPDGKRVRYEARSDVLHGPATIESMRGFYAPGGTRIQALDVLLGLALVGGVSAPLGHLLVRKLLARKDKP